MSIALAARDYEGFFHHMSQYRNCDIARRSDQLNGKAIRRISVANKKLGRIQETPTMLYLFKTDSGVEIAWNGRLNKQPVESRIRQLDTRFSLFGFIRTRGLG